ncbi:MAG: DUF4255 domain-containing protein [Verrucomicrobiales bacterium]|nr:DUF4255 domain-containing protein [Verrucomicrobiales bacterium]
MSDFRGIAAVTGALRNLLQTGIQNDVPGGLVVTTREPDRARQNNTGNQLNVFLYHVMMDGAWRNQEIPRQPTASDLHLPPLGLQLFYLLSAFEAETAALEAQDHQILGRAMNLLHDHPLLSPAEIDNALAGTGLQNQVERIRITYQPLSLDEISKLWTSCQTNYRLSVAYQVSVVLIDSTRPRRSALPVREPRLLVSTLRRPMIEEVQPASATTGAVLRLLGTALAHPRAHVRLGSVIVPAAVINDAELQVTIPPGVQAGVTSIQVIHRSELDTPASPHPAAGTTSNIAAFLLSPQITTALPVSVAAGAELTLAVTPPVGRDQRVTLLLDDLDLEIIPRPASDPPTSSTVRFAIPGTLPPKAYLARLLVDGAQSALVVDTNPASPTFRSYLGPIVTVT